MFLKFLINVLSWTQFNLKSIKELNKKRLFEIMSDKNIHQEVCRGVIEFTLTGRYNKARQSKLTKRTLHTALHIVAYTLQSMTKHQGKQYTDAKFVSNYVKLIQNPTHINVETEHIL